MKNLLRSIMNGFSWIGYGFSTFNLFPPRRDPKERMEEIRRRFFTT